MWDKSKMTLVGRYNKEIKIDTEYYYTSSRWESNIIRRLKLILSTTTLIVGGSQNANGQIPIVLHTSRTTLFTKSINFLTPPPPFFF